MPEQWQGPGSKEGYNLFLCLMQKQHLPGLPLFPDRKRRMESFPPGLTAMSADLLFLPAASFGIFLKHLHRLSRFVHVYFSPFYYLRSYIWICLSLTASAASQTASDKEGCG